MSDSDPARLSTPFRGSNPSGPIPSPTLIWVQDPAVLMSIQEVVKNLRIQKTVELKLRLVPIRVQIQSVPLLVSLKSQVSLQKIVISSIAADLLSSLVDSENCLWLLRKLEKQALYTSKF
jgi:hypothetical protein